MRLNTTGIAARMMLSLDKKAIGEKLINGRQINPTPLQVRYPQGVREVLGIMSEQLAALLQIVGGDKLIIPFC
ncbi:hypothetical protein HEO80_021710 [Escherichia coli]|nr:hypothetical protein [Escherichia coli]